LRLQRCKLLAGQRDVGFGTWGHIRPVFAIIAWVSESVAHGSGVICKCRHRYKRRPTPTTHMFAVECYPLGSRVDTSGSAKPKWLRGGFVQTQAFAGRQAVGRSTAEKRERA
jgi:hypothetical protein